VLNLDLYGGPRRRGNPGESQHVDMGGACPQQRAGAGIDGGPDVKTSSISTTRLPAIPAFCSADTRNTPCTLLARSGDGPTCCGVARTRLRTPSSTGAPLISEIVPASAAV
jgi:hypothetical protein